MIYNQKEYLEAFKEHGIEEITFVEDDILILQKTDGGGWFV